MKCNCEAKELLDFEKHEVENVYDLMSCLQGPISNSVMKRAIMLMLRGHYSSGDNYPQDLEHLRCYTWKPSRDSTLAVDFTHNFDDKHPDKVPGIFVGFAGVSLRKIGIGDHHSYTDDRAGEHLVRSSKLGIRIHHITNSIDDSYDLAEMSQLFMLAMSRVLRESTGAEGFEVMGYAEATKNKLSSQTSNYEVVLSLEITYTLAATLSEESHRIRSISAAIASTQ